MYLELGLYLADTLLLSDMHLFFQGSYTVGDGTSPKQIVNNVLPHKHTLTLRL